MAPVKVAVNFATDAELQGILWLRQHIKPIRDFQSMSGNIRWAGTLFTLTNGEAPDYMEDLVDFEINPALTSMSLTPPISATGYPTISDEPTQQELDTPELVTVESDRGMSESATHERYVNDLRDTLVTAHKFMQHIGDQTGSQARGREPPSSTPKNPAPLAPSASLWQYPEIQDANVHQGN